MKELQDKGFNFTYRYGDDEHWEWATDKKLYFFDFYIPELNFVIELNGDYWHCKPDKYSCDYIHELYVYTPYLSSRSPFPRQEKHQIEPHR